MPFHPRPGQIGRPYLRYSAYEHWDPGDFLSFALGLPVLLLRRWRLARVPAVIVVLILAFSIIGGIWAFLGTQRTHPAEELPGYQTNITQKIHSLRHTTNGVGSSTVLRQW